MFDYINDQPEAVYCHYVNGYFSDIDEAAEYLKNDPDNFIAALKGYLTLEESPRIINYNNDCYYTYENATERMMKYEILQYIEDIDTIITDLKDALETLLNLNESFNDLLDLDDFEMDCITIDDIENIISKINEMMTSTNVIELSL